jgi:hypothetical protein
VLEVEVPLGMASRR